MLPTTPLPLNVVTSNVTYVYSCSQCEFKTHVESLFKQHVDSVHLGIPNVPTNAVLGQNTVQIQPQTIVMAAAAAAQQMTSGQVAVNTAVAPSIDKLHKCPKCNLLLPSKNQLTLHKRKVHGKTAIAAGTGGVIPPTGVSPVQNVTYAVVSSQSSSSSSSVVASLVQPVSVLASVSASAPVTTVTSQLPPVVATSTNITGKKTYSCTACGYSTTRRDGLSQHYDSVHLKIKNHQCELCPYAASQKGTLNRHVKLRHKKKVENTSSTSVLTS